MTAVMDNLSHDAKLAVACHFAFGQKASLTFQTPWNISERMAAALTEARDKGVLTLQIGEEGLYAWTYRLANPIEGLMAWMQENKDSAKGFAIMKPERQERPPSDWQVPNGFKRHPK